MVNETKELWCPAVGYEGLYEVSNMGRVRSIFPDANGMRRERVLRSAIKKESGYIRLNLRKDGATHYHYAHVLILESWVCRRPNKQDADHIDGDRANNRLSNLRWLPRLINRSMPRNKNGNSRLNFMKLHGRPNGGDFKTPAKLNSEQVSEIKDLLSRGMRNVEIAKRFPVCKTNISKIKNGLTWKFV